MADYDYAGSAYQYEALSEEVTAIRLFKILPSSWHDEAIQIHMTCVELASAPQYNYLSYVWGSGQQDNTIFCNGHQIAIGKNLWHAIHTLRGENRGDTHPGFFWADALCINQNDIVERNYQVSKMPEILLCAAQTIIWIDVDGRNVVDLISRIFDVGRQVFRDPGMPYLNQILPSSLLLEYGNKLSQNTQDGWEDLNTVLSQTYFNRAWIVQEIVCSRNPTIFFRQGLIPWAKFSRALEEYISCAYPNIIAQPQVRLAVEAEIARQRHLDDRLPFCEALDVVRTRKCTDPRDKIYAALFVFDGPEKQQPDLLHPDYSQPLGEIYMTAAFALNIFPELGGYFSALSMVEDSGSRRSKSEGLPSWTPDWMRLKETYRLNTMDSLLSASDGRSAQITTTTPGSLRLGINFRGCVVDTLDCAPHYLPPRAFCDKYTASGDNSMFFSCWYDLARQSGQKKYKGNQDRLLLHWVETIQAKGCELWQSQERHNTEDLLAQARTFLEYLEDENQGDTTTEEIRQFYAACLPAHGRKFGITRRGNFCLVPRYSSAGDLICIPFGSKVPFAFRPAEEHYISIGECYVHGAMHGEALTWENIQEKEFLLK